VLDLRQADGAAEKEVTQTLGIAMWPISEMSGLARVAVGWLILLIVFRFVSKPKKMPKEPPAPANTPVIPPSQPGN
jgi:hypothetical protein